MSGAALEVAHDHHPAGEYTFVPAHLTLSIVRGSALTLEQVSEGRLWVGRSTRGAINVMPPGLPRVFRHHAGCSFACVTIPSRKQVDVKPRLVLRDDPLRLIVESLLAARELGDDSQLFRDAVAQGVLARLLELDRNAPAAVSNGLRPASMSRVVEYLDAHLAEDVSVEDLSSVVGLRPAQFSTLFRETFGEPPHQHVIRLRVERARRLIEHGADPSHAALAVGFYDQSHLARHMRRLLGVTPGTIARTIRAAVKHPRHQS